MKANTVLIAVTLAAAAAAAQVPVSPVAPRLEGAPALAAATPWLAIVYSLVAAVAICVVGFKSSHRTHLD